MIDRRLTVAGQVDAIDAAEAAFARLPKGELLLRYQQRVVGRLRAGVSLLVIRKSRRIGLTWGLAAYAVLKAAAQRSAGGDHVFYMGYEQDMAREFIDACAMWARAFGHAASAVHEELFDDVDEEGNPRSIRALRITFGEFRIVALPSVPRAFRGKQGVVIIDEAAFHAKLEEKIKAALALLMWGGQVVIVSTHDGVANPFNQLCDRIEAGTQRGELLTITFDDAIADGLYERNALVQSRRGRSIEAKAEWIANIRAFYGDNAAEELDVIPKEGGGSLIKPEDLAACESADAGKPELYAGGLFYIGRDIARRRDGQIIWGFELVGDVLWLRDRWEGIGQSFEAQRDAADAMIRTRRMTAYWLDQGGMGEPEVEAAQRRYGTSRAIGQLLTGQNRIDIALSLKDRFERGLIRVPADPVIRADLRAIAQLGSSGGAVRIGDDPKGNVHADRFWAAALASRAADLPPMEYAYTPAGRGRADPFNDDDARGGFGRRGTW